MKKKNPHAQALGKLGGTARASKLSDAQKQEIARKGAAQRWKDHVPKRTGPGK